MWEVLTANPKMQTYGHCSGRAIGHAKAMPWPFHGHAMATSWPCYGLARHACLEKRLYGPKYVYCMPHKICLQYETRITLNAAKYTY